MSWGVCASRTKPKAVLDIDSTKHVNNSGSINGYSKVKLSKKDLQLLGYAVGEMYYDKEYMRTIELCDRVKACCEIDEKTAESLNRWERKCREK